ncbi:MAG: hypothetical protein ACTHJX_14565 [Terriglobales bacterium]|jgi:hypothetical protein
MAMFEGVLRAWQRSTCHHRWLRARWADGTYGLRCSRCMMAYPKTWEDVIGGTVAPQPPATTPTEPAVLSELGRTA